MADVYLARDPELEREVALKLLRHDGAGPRARQLFLREARALAALNHAGIVTIYETGSDGEHDYIAMEYLPGKNLRARHAAHPFAVGELAAIGVQVATAIDAAHQAGVLHRDIKPENIMVPDGHAPKVVDFGIARRVGAVVSGGRPSKDDWRSDETLPRRGGGNSSDSDTLFGTPAYMAPEALRGGKLGTAADVYSLGVTLYELMAGSHPYGAGSVGKLIDRVVDPAVTATPLDAITDVPAGLSLTLARMLADAPAKRPSMAAVAEQLVEYADDPLLQSGSGVYAGAIVPAHTEPVPERSRWRRTKIATSLALASALLLFGVRLVASPPATAPATAAHALSPDSQVAIEPPAAPNHQPELAVLPFSTRLLSFPSGSAGSMAIPVALNAILSEVPGLVLRVREVDAVRRQVGDEPPGSQQWARAAARNGIRHVLTGSLEEEDGQLILRARIINTITLRGQELTERTAPAGDFGLALRALATEVAEQHANSALPANAQTLSTQSLRHFEDGMRDLDRRDWESASMAFAMATVAEPDFFAAWYQLALARSWAGRPRGEAIAAATRAAALARTSRDRDTMHGLIAYLENRYDDARKRLAPLAEAHPYDRDLLYLLGEVEYHDGHLDRGLGYFREVGRIAPGFAPAYHHRIESALLRTDENGGVNAHEVRSLSAQLGDESAFDQLAFAQGRYEELIARDRMTIESLLVLDRELNPRHLAAMERSIAGRSQRMAITFARGDRPAAGREFERAMEMLATAADRPHVEAELLFLAEVVIATGLEPELRALIEAWPRKGEIVSLTWQQVAVHAAYLTGELPDERTLNHRFRRVLAAVELERADKPREAARIWQELLTEPEQLSYALMLHGLVRSLVKAGASSELRSACRRVAHPPHWRNSLLVTRAMCRSAGATTNRRGQ